ncbi:MAG TPA: hypothetical protein VG347_13615 [Verrucomicrobiae bacterium]|nr:hypothetical protein [Verrucomicrobiae bacterium]
MNNSAREENFQGGQHGPYAVNVPVWVQCNGYRCMAVLNYKGEWRTYPNHEPLTDIVQILGEFPEP